MAAFQQDYPRLNDLDHLKKALAWACFVCSWPDICPSHEAIKQMNPVGLKDIDARNIDIYLYSQEARSPRLLFCWLLPGFRFWQAGAWRRIKDESEVLRRDTTRPNPRLRDQPFDFHVTASLLGTIATAFCRGGQLERPGDVICGGNRRISAVQAPSSSAHPFARSLGFTCQGLRRA